jgi:apolipoprotein D and lipocalin family protein
LAVLATALAAAPARNETVPYVDLERYLGTWYEIARFDERFERGCVGVTATYSKNPDGTIAVQNRCHEKTLDGKVKLANGKAFIADEKTNAKLKVQFFWPFKGDYWVLELGDQYEYAVVGHPKREHCWILSRTPTMPDDVYQGILKRLTERGYDVTKLLKVPQKPAPVDTP